MKEVGKELQLHTGSVLQLNPSLKGFKTLSRFKPLFKALCVPELIGHTSQGDHTGITNTSAAHTDSQCPLHRCLLSIWDLEISTNRNSSEGNAKLSPCGAGFDISRRSLSPGPSFCTHTCLTTCWRSASKQTMRCLHHLCRREVNKISLRIKSFQIQLKKAVSDTSKCWEIASLAAAWLISVCSFGMRFFLMWFHWTLI